MNPSAAPTDVFGEHDIHLFREGTHSQLYRKMGCHLGAEGARFAVWAPNAAAVSVVGEFNAWQGDAHPAEARWDGSGIWEVQVPAVRQGQRYKFRIRTRDGALLDKADPFARHAELPPATASVVWRSDDYDWHDDAWMRERSAPQCAGRADVHLRGAPGFLAPRRGRHARSTTVELAQQLADYVTCAWASPTSS